MLNPALQFLSPIAKDIAIVNERIRSAFQSEIPLIYQIADHIIHSGGKRLRPILVLLTARSIGHISAQHHLLAVIIELIHTATLLHDDVVDKTTLRRGKSTANHIFGNSHAVLVGDFMYSRAFQLMTELHDLRIMDILSYATNKIAEGEILQLLNMHNEHITETMYFAVIHCKTAQLFSSATQLSSVIHNTNKEIEDIYRAYGWHLGIAFQLIDDILDFVGDTTSTGKNLYGDLKEGKLTLPLIYALQQGTLAQQQQIKAELKNPDPQNIDKLLTIIQETKALDYTKSVAQREIQLAISSIKGISHETSLLEELANFCIERRI